VEDGLYRVEDISCHFCFAFCFHLQSGFGVSGEYLVCPYLFPDSFGRGFCFGCQSSGVSLEDVRTMGEDLAFPHGYFFNSACGVVPDYGRVHSFGADNISESNVVSEGISVDLEPKIGETPGKQSYAGSQVVQFPSRRMSKKGP